MALNAWHQDQVITPPEGARTIATGENCAHAGLAIGDHTMTLQPHPEFNAKLIELFINERFKGIVPDDLRDSAAAQLDQPVANPTVMERMAAHLKGASHG